LPRLKRSYLATSINFKRSAARRSSSPQGVFVQLMATIKKPNTQRWDGEYHDQQCFLAFIESLPE
jgi:hypothetical protein